MHSLRSPLSENDVLYAWSRNFVIFCDVPSNILADGMDAQRVGIASSTDNLIKDALGTLSSVDVDQLVIDKIGICHTGNHLPEESDGFLVELLRVTDVAEGHRVERII